MSEYGEAGQPAKQEQEIEAKELQSASEVEGRVQSTIAAVRNKITGLDSPKSDITGFCIEASREFRQTASIAGLPVNIYFGHELEEMRTGNFRAGAVHAFDIAGEITDDQEELYLIDLTLRQAVTQEKTILYSGLGADTPLAKELLTKGYVRLNDGVLNQYLDLIHNRKSNTTPEPIKVSDVLNLRGVTTDHPLSKDVVSEDADYFDL